MELEDKAKVVASDWGTEFVQFLAALAVLPWPMVGGQRPYSYLLNKSMYSYYMLNLSTGLGSNVTPQPVHCLGYYGLY